MKIVYHRGDMFKTNIQHIVHGCNAHGVMGSGVAAIVRRDYPEAYEQYVLRHKRQAWKVGDIQIVESNGKTIINAITQHNFGGDGIRYVSYDGIAEALSKINRELDLEGFNEVVMPQIGAGLGGGDWKVIEAIIESEMTDVVPHVYVL